MQVLLIEHDQVLANSIVASFKNRGEAVDLLAQGDMAQQFLLTYAEGYDLVILSSDLPSVSGGDICRAVRSAGVEVPIIMLIKKSNFDHREELFACGADDYLIEPFTFEELRLRADAVRRQVPVIQHAGHVALNVLEQTIQFNEETIELTDTEFGLLAYLVRHAGKPVERQELFREVWEEDTLLTSNVVDVHIKNLRKKVQAIGAARAISIDTVRGVGYRLSILS